MEQVAALPTGSTVSVTASPCQGDEGHDRPRESSSRSRISGSAPPLGAFGRGPSGPGFDRSSGWMTAGFPGLSSPAATASPMATTSTPAHCSVTWPTSGIRSSKWGSPAIPRATPRFPTTGCVEALLDKQAHATYIVTQMCFNAKHHPGLGQQDPGPVRLPIKVGIPGAVEPTRLLTMAARSASGTR